MLGGIQIVNPQSIHFPITPTEEEEKLLTQWLKQIRDTNERVAKDFWIYEHTLITGSTSTRSFFKWNTINVVFEPLADHILKAVLLVALRFNWPPEEILALWQIEGLPTFRNLEKEGISWDPRSIGFLLRNPEGRTKEERKAEARAFARSIVLFQRWGLDVLVPHRWQGGDNHLIYRARKQQHDEAFLNGSHQPPVGSTPNDQAEPGGFEEQIKPYLPTSPFDYLTDPKRSPIRVKRSIINGEEFWQYGTMSEYQTTMLAMQYARFKYLQTRIPKKLDVKGIKLNLDPPFPAFVRTHYNCHTNRGRKTLLDALKALVIEEQTLLGKSKNQYDSEDLNLLFITKKLPRNIQRQIRGGECLGVCQCYLGALRFEVLRRTYKVLFNNTL
jgi:hypothetical protein